MGRGLEPAGVDLQAKGFREYLAKLQQIEKRNREVFDQDFKGTGLSYNQVTSAARKYEQQLKNTTRAQSQLNSALNQLALGVFSRRTAELVIESAKAAAAFQGQSIGLNNLAAQYGQSGTDIRDAMRRASQGVLSESAIIQAANQQLLLGVSQTPEQFEEVTRTAVILGRAMGLTATQAIEQFTTALGRRSLLILDNFGISSKAVREEIERLAQVRFGETADSLDQATRDALFMEAALKIASQAAETISDESLKASEGFDRLTAQAENLKIVFGTAVAPEVGGIGNLLADAAITAQQLIAFISAGAAGIGVILDRLGVSFNVLERIQQLARGEIGIGEAITGFDPQEFIEGIGNIDEVLDEAAQAALERFKDIARAQGVAFPEDKIDNSTKAVEENTEALEDNEDQIKALQNAIRQAEQLELSFARAAEDAARKQARQVAKLKRDQFKERQKFLNDQAKEFDDFNKDQAEAVAEAEKDLAKERERANKERVREQDKLFRELRQAQDRFNLDRVQSERRFNLDERRLRAEGDILGLQELRENFALGEQEAAENFDLQQRQRKEDAKDQEQQQDEQRQERVQAAEQELKDLQSSFAERQAEFLKQQDEEFQALLTAQNEQRLALQESFAEQEEDRRISQQRQLEDLGRSLAAQEDITAEGAAATAQQLEEAFGVEGVADQIMSGFTARQESAFQSLFESITEGAKTTKEQLEELAGTGGAGVFGATGFEVQPVSPERVAGFQHGGSFEVGGTGGADSQLVAFRATPGERVTVTPQSQTFRMPIAAPSQLNVSFGGRSQIDVTGLEGASQATIDAAVEQMIQIQDIAIRRILRRHGVN